MDFTDGAEWWTLLDVEASEGSGEENHVQCRYVWMMSCFRQWREELDENGAA